MNRSAIALAAIAAVAFSATAYAVDTWNGTWAGGFTGGDGAQLTFADDQLIGFFWDGDYLSAVKATGGNAGAPVSITWAAGSATVTRDGTAAAHITVTQKGKPDVTVALVPDH